MKWTIWTFIYIFFGCVSQLNWRIVKRDDKPVPFDGSQSSPAHSVQSQPLRGLLYWATEQHKRQEVCADVGRSIVRDRGDRPATTDWNSSGFPQASCSHPVMLFNQCLLSGLFFPALHNSLHPSYGKICVAVQWRELSLLKSNVGKKGVL